MTVRSTHDAELVGGTGPLTTACRVDEETAADHVTSIVETVFTATALLTVAGNRPDQIGFSVLVSNEAGCVSEVSRKNDFVRCRRGFSSPHNIWDAVDVRWQTEQ